MTVAANVVLPQPELEDHELLAAALLDDLAAHLRAGDRRLTDRHAATVSGRHEQDLVEHDWRALLTGERLDHDGLAGLDSVLLSTRRNDGVHDGSSKKTRLESRTLRILGLASSLLTHRLDQRSDP